MRTVLEQASRCYGKKPALIYRDQPVSFEDVLTNTNKLANVLTAMGVGPGDKVAFYLPNNPLYVYGYLAAFTLGAVGVPLDFMLTQEELRSCLDHSETKVLIAFSKPEVDVAVLLQQVPSLKDVLLWDKDIPTDVKNGAELMDQASNQFIAVDPDPEDLALIMYTSGTTGRPKGIMLTYRHLKGSPEAMKHFVDLTDRDVKLAAIPLSHVGGFIYIQNCLHFGITVVLMDRFNPYKFLEYIRQYRVTCFHIVPAMYTAMLCVKQIEQYDLSSLRWVVVFGAPSSPEMMERFHRYCPNARLLNGWGMTETCPPNTVTPLDSDNIVSVGKPAPHCEIRVVDEKGRPVPTGGVGEVTLRGWVVMKGYYKDEETTRQTIRDGWLYTGDLGRFDEDGFLYIVGRKKEMIKVGGQLVHAFEVEAAFYKHPDVAEAAVVGAPDALRGEVVRAVVVLREGASLTEEDLRYFVKDRLAHFKVPQSVEIRSSLPKNRTGKVDKARLRQEVCS